MMVFKKRNWTNVRRLRYSRRTKVELKAWQKRAKPDVRKNTHIQRAARLFNCLPALQPPFSKHTTDFHPLRISTMRSLEFTEY